jgi:hypothetical protein
MDAARIPSPDAYAYALLTLEPRLPPKHRALLVAHYGAPGHTLTAAQLAAAVGYPSFSAVNLQYGTFAKRLCGLLGRNPEFYVLILATFEEGGAAGHLNWVMRPEIVAAFERLGWVAAPPEV